MACSHCKVVSQHIHTVAVTAVSRHSVADVSKEGFRQNTWKTILFAACWYIQHISSSKKMHCVNLLCDCQCHLPHSCS